ncbi:MAG: hypothetical protein Q4D65_03530 [Peptostreptococcaceae bacterium]|nr:hypothetical protein [Peptostreptococcaceae bacterium]
MEKASLKYGKIILAILGWFILFGFTVQIGFSYRLFSMFLDTSALTIAGSILNILMLIVFFVLYKEWAKEFFRIGSKWVLILYILMIIGMVTIPLHYHLELPVGVYMFFITISVLWQNFITFGLLQNYLRERISFCWVMLLMAMLFPIAHAVYIDGFLSQKVAMFPLAAIMAVIFSFFREKTGRLHFGIFIHLLLYILTA